MYLKIAEVYSQNIESRYKNINGKYVPNSAEEFRDEYLIPYLNRSIKTKEKLYISFNDLYSYSYDFIEELFGGLIRKGIDAKTIYENTHFICDDDLILADSIKNVIKSAENAEKRKLEERNNFLRKMNNINKININDDDLIINVAEDYTKTPCNGYEDDGMFSGEMFREKILIPRLNFAINNDKFLIVNLDNVYGYSTVFLKVAFGGLARRGFDYDLIMNRIIFISKDYENLINDIKKYIKESEKKEKEIVRRRIKYENDIRR